MCLRTFIKFTFSTKETFHQALDKIDKDGLGINTVEGQLCLITNAEGLDLEREPYEVIKEKASFIHVPFRGWKELEKLRKLSKDYPVCGEIIIEVVNGLQFIDEKLRE